MDKKKGLAVAGAVAAGGLILADVLLKRRKEVILIDREMPAPPEQVIDLIMQVERESEFIPIVSSVRVYDRGADDVGYLVKAAYPMPASVRYRKWRIRNPPAVYWESEQGTFGFHNNGEIAFTEENGRVMAHLKSEHWVTAPVIGRLSAPAVAPILQTELEAWLDNLARELGRR